MASTMADESKISIKVSVDKQKNKVVYAEADHTFVDVLFSFMTLPLGAIAKLLHKQSDEKNNEVLKSINNLYGSLVDLPGRYFMNEECKYTILNPISPASAYCRKLKVSIDDTEPKKYFICQSLDCARHMARFSNCCKAICWVCHKTMDQEVSVIDDDNNCDGGGVFVSDVSTFIVTDDLRVMPYTPGSCIQLLQNLGVTDASQIEEKTVDLSYQQIVDLLGLSLKCNSPLTYLLLRSPRDLISSEHDIFDVCTLAEEKNEYKMFLQVCIQKSTGKVLFAEAEEDFVDFISGFLAITLGTVIGNFMKGNSSMVCMDNIYRSISEISEQRYFRSDKNVLLCTYFGRYVTRNLIFPLRNRYILLLYLCQTIASNSTGKVYRKAYETLLWNTYENRRLNREVLYFTLNDPRFQEELWKPSGMFMLTDDLIITPSSSTSTMNILSKCNVALNDIERHKVGIGLKEGIRMLYASMISSSTLSKGLEHQLKILKQST